MTTLTPPRRRGTDRHLACMKTHTILENHDLREKRDIRKNRGYRGVRRIIKIERRCRGYPEIIGHVQIPANRLQMTPGWPSVPANLGAAKAHLSSTQAQLVGASTAGLLEIYVCKDFYIIFGLNFSCKTKKYSKRLLYK